MIDTFTFTSHTYKDTSHHITFFTHSFEQRRNFAAKSWEFNANSQLFKGIFPDLIDAKQSAKVRRIVAKQLYDNNMRIAMFTGVAIICFTLIVIWQLYWV
jgi:hypothetical protein